MFYNNIFSIIFYNATNNTAVIELFNRQLKSSASNDLYHIRCVCYIINVIVKNRLKTFEDKIKKIKEVMPYIRSSTYRNYDLKKVISHKGQNVRAFY